MRKFLLLSFMLMFAFTFSESWAQERTVSGKVTSVEDGSTLPGVNVVLKGTTTGTVTDIDGNYKLSVPSGGGTLVFSFIGLATEEIEIGSRSVVDVSMAADVKQLSEVVVTGYGDRSKQSFTGSSAQLSGDAIENIPVASADQMLQGNVAGVQLSSSSGTPGSVQDIRIRGISSITASNSPLFVIDGVPVVSGDIDQNTSTGSLGILSSLNPQDIQEFTVLKDATATALYGARGANGVIIITTKGGKAGKTVFNASLQTGMVSRAVDGPQMLNSKQWDELWYESIVNAGYYPDVATARANEDSGWDGVTDTNWTNVVTNDDAKQLTFNLSARGGNENSNFYASLGYFNQDGAIIGVDYDRLNGKIDFTNRLSDKVTLKTSTLGSYADQNGQLEGSAYFGNPEAAPLFTLSIDPVYNDDGTPNLNISSGTFNPVYIMSHDISNRKQARIFNSTSVDIDIMENLRFSSTLGLDYINNEEHIYRNRVHGDGAGQNGSSYIDITRNFNWLWKNRLNYDWKVNPDNDFNFTVVYEAQRNNYLTSGSGGYGIAADELFYPSSVATPDYASGYTTDWGINSILGIVNYGFKNKLFVDLSFRREGNSRFSPEYRWGSFWAAGLSYVLSEEAFMSSMSDWLSQVKLKASYGKNGNAGVGLNAYQAFLSYSGSYYGQPTVEPSQLGNIGLTWENSDYFNAGASFALFNKVDVSVEYFNRTNYDLLLDVPLSRTTGFNNQTQNIGEMVNKGIEATLNADIISNQNFKWNIGLNLTSIKNEVTSLPSSAAGDEIGITSSTRVVTQGQPVYSWYMPTWAGVDPDNGDPLWYVEGSGGETTNDYTQAGKDYHKSAAPTFYGGVNTRIDFKGVWVSANLYYSTGNNVYDSWAYYTQSDGRFTPFYGGYARLYDRWQQPGDISDNPVNVYGNTSLSNSTSTRRLYDGTFLRLRDLTLGYQLPTSLLSNIGVERLSVYVKGTNMFTWVKDDKLEFDPEVKADGYLDITAPPMKVLSFGINVDF